MKKRFYKNHGFSLVELLVTISIVSVLSSIVYAAVTAAREKGRLGGAKYFSAQAYHVSGEQAVGIWDFDENSGTVSTADKSGFGNTANFSVTPPTWSTDTPSGSVSSLSFNGGSSYALVNNSSTFDTSTVTVTAWAKTSASGGGYRKVIGKGPDPTEVYGFWLNLTTGAFFVEREINNIQAGLVSTKRINDGLWHHLAYSYNGTTEALYVDGQLVASNNITGTMTSNTENISIGAEKSSTTANYYWSGLIDEVRVYNKGLVGANIRAIYAEGLPRHERALASRL